MINEIPIVFRLTFQRKQGIRSGKGFGKGHKIRKLLALHSKGPDRDHAIKGRKLQFTQRILHVCYGYTHIQC